LYQKTQGVMGSVWPEICSYATDIQLLLPSADVLCIAPHLMDLEQQLLTVASGEAAAAATRVHCFRVAPDPRPLYIPAAATVHIMSHGGLSYALMFSRDHSSVSSARDHDVAPPPLRAATPSHFTLHPFYSSHTFAQALLLVEKDQVLVPPAAHRIGRDSCPPPSPPPLPQRQRAKEAYVVPTLPWLRATYLHRSQQSRFLHEVALAALHAAASAGERGRDAMAEAEAAVLAAADKRQAQRPDAPAAAE
jgi:hypothetical protein